jgi:hypothetical protein
MTNKKPITSQSAPASQATNFDAATLQNMAHQPAPPGVHDDASRQSIIELLTKLSPSNLHLVENIIRVIVDEYARESD